MKKILSLALAITVSSLGLISLPARAARAQEVASAGKSLDEIKEEYARLLAIERDPSTPTEARELNRTFLEARRAQLADALRKRIAALRRYQTSVVTSLSDDERRVVEGSIQQLSAELQALQPARSDPPAPAARAARATRRPPAAAQSRSVAAQPKRPAPASDGGEAESADEQPTPDPGASRARKAAAIEITSPERDKTVHVGEVEVEIRVNDEDVDDLMVAVYTPASEKPKSARTLELKRSDKGVKSFVVSLSEGENRVEVSDLKRGEVKAERTLTFTPANAPSIGGNAASMAGSNPSTTPTPPANTFTVCGQAIPESLIDTFALIKGAPYTPVLQNLAARLNNPADPVNQSSIDSECKPTGVTPGAQKLAVVKLLQDFLTEWERIDTMGTAADASAKQALHATKMSRATVRSEINLLNSYLSNVKVTINPTDSSNPKMTPTINLDGNYIAYIPADKKGEYTISTEGDDEQSARTFMIPNATAPASGDNDYARVNLFVEDRPVSLLTRAVVGYEQVGASAAKKNQDFFFDLFLSKPFPFGQSVDPDFGERLRMWGSIRVASVPQPGTATVGELTSGFVTQVSGLAVKDVANVFDFLAGFEYRVSKLGTLRPSFDRKTTLKFSASLIGSFGAITPTDPQQSITVFKVFPDAPGLPPEAKGKDFVAFVASDRDKFFRQYFVGARIQGFFFNKFNMPIQRFPTQLDVTVGQSEYVTGGALRGPVIRIDGYFPLPFRGMEFVNLYGTAIMRPGPAKTGIPLVLEPAPAGTTVPAANVALIEVRQSNRDIYRAGVGIDFISFTKKFLEAINSKK